MEEMLVAQPTTNRPGDAEQLVRVGKVDIVVVNWWCSCSKGELDGDMGDSHMGSARLSQALRMTGSVSNRTRSSFYQSTALQNRSDVWQSRTTTGGNALKFYASVRLDVRAPPRSRGDEFVVIGSGQGCQK